MGHSTKLRVISPLDGETEAVVNRVIGCCIQVHRVLGPGLMEGPYRRALCIEFRDVGLAFEAEKRLPVVYRGFEVGSQRLDVVVEQRVLVELKSVDRLAPIHHAQVMSYLRVSKLRVALLVNFNVRIIPHGLQRIVV